MMKTMVLLGFCVFLTACAAPTETGDDQALTMKLLEYTTPSTVSVLLDSTMPLYVWNEAQSRYEIHMMDLSTGQDVPSYPPFVVGENEFIGPNTLSPNGQKLAIASANGEYCYPSGGGTACMGRADVLHIIDQQAWQEVTATLPGEGWAGPILFSPDTRQLVLIFNEPKYSTVMLFDTNTGKLIAQQEIAFNPSLMKYTSDGATLVLYGQSLGSDPGISKPGSPRIVLMDALTLEVKWERELPNIVSGYWCVEKCDAPHGEQTFAEWTPAVILAPDGNELYIVHAAHERISTVHFNTRTLETTEIQKEKSWFERLLTFDAEIAHAKGNANGAFKAGVISPDGTRLYVVGYTMTTTLDTNGEAQPREESLGLEVIEVASGNKLSSADSKAAWIKITPDGTHLILGNWGQGQIEVIDTATLKTVTRLPRQEVVITRSLDGQPIILGSQSGHSLTKLSVIDLTTFHIVRSWSLATSYASWVLTP
jgi:DNA-binding beta-propeller fold protein YncE